MSKAACGMAAAQQAEDTARAQHDGVMCRYLGYSVPLKYINDKCDTLALQKCT